MIGRATVLAATVSAVLAWPEPSGAQEPGEPSTAAPADVVAAAAPSRGGTVAKVLTGGAIGLGLHEAGHLLFDVVFDAGAGVAPVSFGPIPFFAITHEPVSPAREYTIAAAGFWMQHASSEWLLTRRPDLREERAPLLKGLLAFNLLASGAYGVAAFARAGPAERDTRGIARELDVDERWVGAMVIAPAALDTWRYLRPESAAARWSSRAAKVAMVLLALRARH